MWQPHDTEDNTHRDGPGETGTRTTASRVQCRVELKCEVVYYWLLTGQAFIMRLYYVIIIIIR